MENKNIIDKLANSGLKKTKIRVNIIALLDKSKSPLSVQEINNQLQAYKIKVNLSTIYRTLDTLTVKKIINKVDLNQEKQALYEYNREEHRHYLICSVCNSIQYIYDCPLGDYEDHLSYQTGFKIATHKVEFHGVCKECQKDKLSNKKNET